jgi:hypothetical protein
MRRLRAACYAALHLGEELRRYAQELKVVVRGQRPLFRVGWSGATARCCPPRSRKAAWRVAKTPGKPPQRRMGVVSVRTQKRPRRDLNPRGSRKIRAFSGEVALQNVYETPRNPLWGVNFSIAEHTTRVAPLMEGRSSALAYRGTSGFAGARREPRERLARRATSLSYAKGQATPRRDYAKFLNEPGLKLVERPDWSSFGGQAET